MVFRETPPQKKQHVAFLRKKLFTGRLFTSQKNTWLSLLFAIFYEINTVQTSQYQSRTGKAKVISNEEEGRWRPKKMRI